MDTNKFGVVEFLDKYQVACCDEDVLACLYLDVLACLDNNNRYGFDVYFLLAYPMEQIIEETLGGKFLFHNGSMQKIGWYETYV